MVSEVVDFLNWVLENVQRRRPARRRHLESSGQDVLSVYNVPRSEKRVDTRSTVDSDTLVVCGWFRKVPDRAGLPKLEETDGIRLKKELRDVRSYPTMWK